MPASVAASSAAAPTTFGRLASSVVGFGGSVLSIRDQSVLNMLWPIFAAISPAMIENGLYRSLIATQPTPPRVNPPSGQRPDSRSLHVAVVKRPPLVGKYLSETADLKEQECSKRIPRTLATQPMSCSDGRCSITERAWPSRCAS